MGSKQTIQRREISRRDFLRLGGVSLAGATLLGAAGCGGGGGAEGGGGPTTLRLAYIFGEDGPADLAAKRFKEIVEEETDGELEVALAPNSQLGGERDLWEGFSIGSIEMALTGDGPVSFFTPEYSAIQMFYAFRDLEHMQEVIFGEIGQEISDALLENQNGRVLDWWDRGPRKLTANQEIVIPEDAGGLQVRDPELPIYAESWRAVGANPVAMPFAELYSALEQGVIDAQENPLELIATSNFNEVQSHVMDTNHVYGPYILAISDMTWQELSPEQQEVVQSAAETAGDYERELTAEYEERYQQELQEGGMTFVEVDQEEWAEAVQPAVEALEEQGAWQEGLYDRIRAV